MKTLPKKARKGTKKQGDFIELNQLYSVVLMLVLIGLIIGVGIVVLSNFGAATAVTAYPAASRAVNGTVDAISPIATTWLPLIVTVAALAIVLVLVIRSFGSFGSR